MKQLKKTLLTLVALFAMTTGAWAQATDEVAVVKTANANEWTFLMPEADVELEMEYDTALALNEEDDNTAILEEWDGYEADVTANRTLKAGMWNTMAAPFGISAQNLAVLQQLFTANDGSLVLKELVGSSYDSGTEVLTLNFQSVRELKAGRPYLVKVPKDLDLATLSATIDALAQLQQVDIPNPFKDVIISKTTVPFTSTYVDFIPTLGKTLVTGPTGEEGNTDAVLFLGANNKLLYPTVVNDQESGDSYIKGFRAYFQLKGDAIGARKFTLNFGDGETTSISEELRMKNEEFATAPVYDLQGRKVNAQPNSQFSILNSQLKKGVYIVDGKKVVVK